MKNPSPCKKCGEIYKETRYRYNYQNKKSYLQSSCRDCEIKESKEYQKNNLDKFREYNKKSYIKKYGPITRNMNHTDESRREWHLQKALKRYTRAKKARVSWCKELTDFVFLEAHSLRKQRNKIFNFEWHVDHIIPLQGMIVSGLHVWNNFAVIPKVENLRKGNYHSIHEGRKA